MPGVHAVSEEDGRITIVGRGENLITDVIHVLSEQRIRVTEFKTLVPTLEDVFLTVTGHSVRE
jgi:ABC-2 type transport system ATP-binding protein